MSLSVGRPLLILVTRFHHARIWAFWVGDGAMGMSIGGKGGGTREEEKKSKEKEQGRNGTAQCSGINQL